MTSVGAIIPRYGALVKTKRYLATLLLFIGTLSCCARVTAPSPSTAKSSIGPREVDALWALAPDYAVAGAVVDGETAVRLFHGLSTISENFERNSNVGLGWNSAEVRRLRHRWGFDMLNVDSWRSMGIDWRKGGAVFVDAEIDRFLLILPVVDRAAFRRATHAERLPDANVDADRFISGAAVCREVQGRYVCAKTLEQLSQVHSDDQVPLAGAAHQRPASQRGGIEALVDLAAAPAIVPYGLSRTLSRLAATPSKAWASLSLERDSLRFFMAVDGGRGELLKALPVPAARPWLVSPDAAGSQRMVLSSAVIDRWLPTKTVIDGVDLRGIFGEIEGEIVGVTLGSDPFAGHLHVPVKNASRVAQTVQDFCARLVASEGGKTASWKGSACEASLAPLPVRVTIGTEGNTLIVRVGEHSGGSDREVEVSALTGSAATRAVVERQATFGFWTRSLEMPANVVSTALMVGSALESSTLDGMSWIGLHLYDVAGALRLLDSGAEFEVAATTFGGTPVAAQEAYEDALSHYMAPDIAAWNGSLTRIEQEFPDTLLGKQATYLQTARPIAGPGSAVLLLVLRQLL